MLKEDTTGDRGLGGSGSGLDPLVGLLRESLGGTDRNRRSRGCARACGPLPFLGLDMDRLSTCESKEIAMGAVEISPLALLTPETGDALRDDDGDE